MLLIRILRETAPSTARVIERNRHFQHCDKLTSCFPQNQFGWIGPSAPHRFKPSPKSHPHVPSHPSGTIERLCCVISRPENLTARLWSPSFPACLPD